MLNDLILRIADLTAYLFPFECMEPEFMRRAMLGLLLIAPLAALSGVQVVNSRMSFFSDAIGHSAFAGVAVGLIFSLPVDFTMPALALVIGLLIMYLRRGSRLSTDTVIGIIFSAVVAFGLAIVNRNREASRGLNMFLYGDVLTIGDNEIALLFVLLVTAILIVPAATARNLARNSRQLFFLSLVFSYVSCAGGLLISAQQWANVPSGAAIVLLASLLFAVSFIAARFRTK